MSVRGPGDTGYDHNIPHLHKAFERMSLEERKPEPYQRPPPSYGQMVNLARISGLPPYKTGGKKSRKRYTNKKRYFSKYYRRNNKRYTKKNN